MGRQHQPQLLLRRDDGQRRAIAEKIERQNLVSSVRHHPAEKQESKLLGLHSMRSETVKGKYHLQPTGLTTQVSDQLTFSNGPKDLQTVKVNVLGEIHHGRWGHAVLSNRAVWEVSGAHKLEV